MLKHTAKEILEARQRELDEISKVDKIPHPRCKCGHVCGISEELCPTCIYEQHYIKDTKQERVLIYQNKIVIMHDIMDVENGFSIFNESYAPIKRYGPFFTGI